MGNYLRREKHFVFMEIACLCWHILQILTDPLVMQNYVYVRVVQSTKQTSLSLLLIGCDDYDEELNKNIFKFVHHL